MYRAFVYALFIGLQGSGIPNGRYGAVSARPQLPPNVRARFTSGGGEACPSSLRKCSSTQRPLQRELIATDYLTSNGATPVARTTHIFYVRVLANNSGFRELRDFQYLTAGKDGEHALREFSHSKMLPRHFPEARPFSKTANSATS